MRLVSVPATNHSRRCGSTGGEKLTSLATSPPGGLGAPEGSAKCRKWTISRHTGAAPETLDTSRIGLPPKLPTHTPTV